jgi:hypothetical protein
MTRATIHERSRIAIPEFAAEIQDHLNTYGECLDHVLFGDLTRFLVAAAREDDWPLVHRGLIFLDAAIMSGDRHLESLVSVSFIENLPPWQATSVEPLPNGFVERLPPHLRAEFDRQLAG